MKRKVLIGMLALSMMLATACGSKKDNTSEKQEQSSKVRVIDKTNKKSEKKKAEKEDRKSDTATEQSEEQETQTKEVTLNHSYTTQYGTVNMITYPSFTFDYPDGWTITDQQVDQQSERVELTNESGITVTFCHIDGQAGGLGGGSSVSASRVEVSKVSDSGFVPGYVQATDYSNLGMFGVMKLKTTGQIDMKTDSDFTDVDGPTSYGVLPESMIGTDEGVNSTYESAFSFYYSGYISMIASSPEGTFTPDEEQEVIAILGSFRVAE